MHGRCAFSSTLFHGLMTVESINNETLIRIPNSINYNFIQDFLYYLSVKSIIPKSKATDEEIDQLTEEVQEEWWQENKSRFLK